MATRNISLTTFFDQFIDEIVATGRYQNASEVVREGLRLLQDQVQESANRREAVRAMIANAEADLAAGDYDALDAPGAFDKVMDDIWDRHVRKHDQVANSRAPTAAAARS